MNQENKEFLKYIGLGWLILSDLLIFIFIGYFVGRKFNQQNIGIILGAILSLVSIGYYIYTINKNN